MNNILITSGTDTQIKSDTTTSVDVHLRDKSHYINVCTITNHIIRIQASTIEVFDQQDNLVATHGV